MVAEVPHLDVGLVDGLLREQAPHWAGLPLMPLPAWGTDNAIFRLGQEMVVRLPRSARAASRGDKERKWVPRLSPHLPLKVPTLLHTGRPGQGYPWCWSVYSWLEGEPITQGGLANEREAAVALARFVRALWQIDPTGGPPAGAHNFFRGVALADRDRFVRTAIPQCQDTWDAQVLTAAWEADLRGPSWQGVPVWIHGDIHGGNLLAVGGRLRAVIDFGGLGLGDPACDLIVAWNLLAAEGRQVFREEVSVDEATWSRGRGWALSIGLIALPCYQGSNPVMVAMAQTALNAVLTDHGLAGLPLGTVCTGPYNADPGPDPGAGPPTDRAFRATHAEADGDRGGAGRRQLQPPGAIHLRGSAQRGLGAE